MPGLPAGRAAWRAIARPLATGEVRVDANLRAAPSLDAQVIGVAKGGRQIRITGTDASGQWLRVERGGEPDAFVAARLIRDLEPSGLECGRDVPTETCQALRDGPQDPQQSHALAELFRMLEEARTQRVPDTSSRRALAGLTAAQVDTRLREVEGLREALGQLN